MLLGKSMDDPAVADYKSKFPYHTLVPTERNTVAFQTIETDENGEHYVYTVEALMAQVSQYKITSKIKVAKYS